MYETLKAKFEREMAWCSFELVRCNDPYRLEHILKTFNFSIGNLHSDAEEIVKELEGNY